jgi:hypothetical protein
VHLQTLLRKASTSVCGMQAQNMIDHEDDIMARPARSWFQTPKQKKAVADAAKATATGRGPAVTSEEKASKKMAGRDGKSKRGSRVQQEPADTAEEQRAVSRGIR